MRCRMAIDLCRQPKALCAGYGDETYIVVLTEPLRRSSYVGGSRSIAQQIDYPFKSEEPSASVSCLHNAIGHKNQSIVFFEVKVRHGKVRHFDHSEWQSSLNCDRLAIQIWSD